MNKYNNHTIYYHPLLKKEISSSLKDLFPGCLKFDSRLEFDTYLEIIMFTPFIKKDYPFKLSVCTIKPDFTLFSNYLIVIETKGFKTRDWILKWKLFEKEYPRVEKHIIKSKKDIKNISIILQNKTFTYF